MTQRIRLIGIAVLVALVAAVTPPATAAIPMEQRDAQVRVAWPWVGGIIDEADPVGQATVHVAMRILRLGSLRFGWSR